MDPVVTEASPEMKKVIVNRDSAHGAISLAEAFLLAGVHHYLGTFWPVSDAAAKHFAVELYGHLAKGGSFGEAVTRARRKLHALNMPDWANYIHYGDPNAVLVPESGTD